MKILSILFATASCLAFGQPEILIEATGKNPNERHVNATPDLIELLVDIDPKAYGYRAQSHDMAVNMTADPLLNGRFTLDYNYKLSSHWKLVFPVSFEHTSLVLPFALPVGISSNNRIDSQWSLLAGVGAKLRLSEWMQKSSFFIEGWLQSGVYAQNAKGFSDTRYAARIRPSLYVGWERIFESGLVFGIKTGIEANLNILTGTPLAYSDNNVNFVPAINLGFAW
ncbi:MAG: hypothetical protein V4534_01925 [Myxococcota bacterium]